MKAILMKSAAAIEAISDELAKQENSFDWSTINPDERTGLRFWRNDVNEIIDCLRDQAYYLKVYKSELETWTNNKV